MLLANQGLSNVECLATSSIYDPLFRSRSSFRVVEPKRPSLTALEQSVVAVSLFDHPSSIKPPCRFVRFLGWICGSSPPNQLANDRLEALRRYCILLREARGTLDDEEEAIVRAAGFTDAALHEASELVALGRCR